MFLHVGFKFFINWLIFSIFPDPVPLHPVSQLTPLSPTFFALNFNSSCRRRPSLLLLSFYSAVVVTIGIYLGEPIRMPERCSTTQTEGVRRLTETMLCTSWSEFDSPGEHSCSHIRALPLHIQLHLFLPCTAHFRTPRGTKMMVLPSLSSTQTTPNNIYTAHENAQNRKQ